MRNHSLDILKFVCAVLVILLHVRTPYSSYYMPLTRCAVPAFLIISGYLLYDKKSLDDKLKRNIKRIKWIGLWATLIYIPIKTILSHGFGFLSMAALSKWVFLNANPFGLHLWYLHAYLYALIIIWYFVKKDKLKWLLYVTPFLLIADLVFGKYSIAIWGKEFPYIYVRNFVCVGVPYVIIGFWIKAWESTLLAFKKTAWILGGGNKLCIKRL